MMIRVLMVLGGTMKYGGTEAFLMNYYRNIDRHKIQFDFVLQGDEPGVYDSEITALGGRIFHVPLKSRHPIIFSRRLREIINQNHYQVVHGQMDAMNAWPLWIAKKYKVPIRISHSHSTHVQTNNFLKEGINNRAKRIIPSVATDLWCCSEAAGTWLYGIDTMNSGRAVVIHNAIAPEKYAFNKVRREEVRNKLAIDMQTYVIGNVGRLSHEKNHRLLLNAFAQVIKARPDSILLLVGDGPLRQTLEKQAKELGIDKKVIFARNQENPTDFYNAMDIFVFPSWYEGLGITFLEAQTNGLFCVCSDGVSKEGCISDVLYLSLHEPVETWSQAILNNCEHGRADNSNMLLEKGYDIHKEAKKLEERYLELLTLSVSMMGEQG